MSGNRGRARIVIQPRDRQLLSELATMRIIDGDLSRLVAGFRSTTRVNTRLLKLTRAGLLNRFSVGTIGGGRKAIYTLSPAAGTLLGIEYRRISRSHGKTLVGDLFVEHQMRVNQVYALVKHRPLPDRFRFVRWLTFYQPLAKTSRLVPDGYFEIQTPSGIRAMFLEIDLSNQSRKVWEQKIRSYLQFAVSGDFERLFRQQQFRVVVITTSERRLRNICTAIAKHTDKLFWLTDFESINRVGFWSSVWLRPTGDHRGPLI